MNAIDYGYINFAVYLVKNVRKEYEHAVCEYANSRTNHNRKKMIAKEKIMLCETIDRISMGVDMLNAVNRIRTKYGFEPIGE